jgi:hypothetical protein
LGAHFNFVIQDWDPDFVERSPMFEPLRQAAAGLRTTDWPSVDDLQRLAAAREETIRSAGGAPLTFVAQEGARPRRTEEQYEARIYLRGEVQVRHANWHDLLNALVWLTFPHAKAALNARHQQALLAQRSGGARNRGPVQDALTLMDEGGVLVAASDPELLRQVERFAWKDLFWRGRARVASDMRFYLFGHALYEKALAPFSGITGRGILLEVGRELLAAPLEAQLERLDRTVAERLREPTRMQSTRELAPVPILGVPGWCAENEFASYYDDATYFRPGRGV